MAKVYEFPTKKELPEVVKESLYDIAKAYIAVVEYTLATVASEDPDIEELEELRLMIVDELTEALDAAAFESTFK